MVLQQSVAATAAAPSTHHVHYGHHHHHGRQNLSIQSNAAGQEAFTTSNQLPAEHMNQPLATVLNLHHSRPSPHRRGSFRSCSSLYNHRNSVLPPPAHQSYYQFQPQQQQESSAESESIRNQSQQSQGLNSNSSAMHDHHHSGHNVHHHHNHHRRNSNHNGANQNSLVNHGPLNGHPHHLNSSSPHYNNSQRQTTIADEYNDVVRKVRINILLLQFFKLIGFSRNCQIHEISMRDSFWFSCCHF